MKKKDLLELFKFYKEEKENPFVGKDLMKAKWWEGEKNLLLLTENDSDAWRNITETFMEALSNKEVSGPLIDKNISFDQRAVYFYLDLWNGKNYPYDSLDDIFEYIKA